MPLRFLRNTNFHKLDQHRGGSRLFRTTLEKALFSSPAACLKTLENRIKKLKKEVGEDHPDIPALAQLADEVVGITPACFTKFQKLVEVLTDKKNPLYWNGKAADDRLVIFTERVATLNFLNAHLPKALKLKAKHVTTLKGTRLRS